jgi:hypothetical protein
MLARQALYHLSHVLFSAMTLVTVFVLPPPTPNMSSFILNLFYEARHGGSRL